MSTPLLSGWRATETATRRTPASSRVPWGRNRAERHEHGREGDQGTELDQQAGPVDIWRQEQLGDRGGPWPVRDAKMKSGRSKLG
jgi:hypothetical protein